ncbi:MAG: hypothetical protein ACE5PM_01675 [Candidatus Hydrothermarchaeales archaeon]
MKTWLYLVLYALIGFLFGVIRPLNSQRRYRECIVSGSLCGVLTGFLMTEHGISTLLLGGVTVGLLISGRLDNIGDYFGLAMVWTMLLYYGSPPVVLSWILVISAATLLDEILTMYDFRGLLERLSEIHPLLNAILIISFIYGVLPLVGIVAFFVSEAAYKIGGMAIEKR